MTRPSDKYLAEVSPREFSEPDYLRSCAADYNFSISDFHKVLTTTAGRKQATKSRPLLWTLIYCRQNLVLKNGIKSGQVTMNSLSLDFFRSAHYWSQPNELPGDRRVCLIAPREAGKSVLLSRILPMYLLTTAASREFICVFTSNHNKAKERMTGVKNLIYAPLIKEDYYKDIRPAMRGGFTESDNMQKLKMANGSVLFCSSITSTAISGLLDDDLRVTCSILDDISPSGGGWSLGEDEKRISTIREVIYDLGKHQRIFWVGTTTAYGSAVHQTLQNKDNPEHWSVRDKWDIRHHLPITQSVDKGGHIKEESFWPQALPLTYLKELRESDDRMFALNYENNPLAAGDGSWWVPELFSYGTLPSHNRRIISVDPGVATKNTSDPSGITVVSLSTAAKKVCIDECFELKAKSIDLKRVVFSLLEKYPDVDTLVWEQNAGGENLAMATLGYDFAQITGVHIKLIHAKQSKLERAELLLSRYKNHQVIHREGADLKAYETELLSMPFYLRSPNMVDAAELAVTFIATAPLPVRR